MKLALAVVALGCVAAAAWFFYRAPPAYDWSLPPDIPAPPVPADNPMTTVKVALGRRLFYDNRLSVNGTMSCARCHMQALAFTDGLPRSVGATGEMHPRGAMSLVNVAYASRLTWANNLLAQLEDQALIPLFSSHPVEMGVAGAESALTELFASDEHYRELFPKAFPQDKNPYSILNLVRATSAFVRSIVSFDSAYDRYLRGDAEAMTAAQIRGMDLFFSERLECFHCHGGFNFSDSTTHVDAVVVSAGYHNTGLYNIGGEGAYPPDNTGLLDMTGERRDMGRFRAPSLRNIEVTAPYMHDGSLATLSDVIAHYERGGRKLDEGPYAGDGRRNPYKSEFIRGFELTDKERADLLDFLHALTDRNALENPRWSAPAME